MPDATILTLEGSETIMALVKTALVNSVLHLWRAGMIAPPPGITTPLLSFTTAEATFTGYAPIVIADVGDLTLLGNAWAVAINERFDPDPAGVTVGNQIGGWFWVTAGGKLIEFGTFDPSRPAQGVGQTIFVTAVVPLTAQQVA